MFIPGSISDPQPETAYRFDEHPRLGQQGDHHERLAREIEEVSRVDHHVGLRRQILSSSQVLSQGKTDPFKAPRNVIQRLRRFLS